MKIIHIAAEMAPLAKVGGLADVVLGLSQEQVKKGLDVKVVLPKYDCLHTESVKHLTPLSKDFTTPWKGKEYPTNVWQGWVGDVNVFFIEPDYPINYFNRGKVYGEPDDVDRFLFFSTAAAHFINSFETHPDIIHLHDWHTSFVANFFKNTLLTIHNLSYQGTSPDSDLNPLKQGIEQAKIVTTVSPTYAQEITTKEFGCGLENTINKNLHKLHGILNGIDYQYWNPETDPHLPHHFSSSNLEPRKIFKRNFLVSEENKPLVASITRLVHQKGIEQLKWAIEETLEKGGQFILLANSPVEEENVAFQQYVDSLNAPQDLLFINGFNESLAHQAYAAADFILIPSLFEPCGLAQMIAFRYGAIPIARETGGLKDTVFDISKKNGNGFTFSGKDQKSVKTTVDRALKYWYSKKDQVKSLQIQGMQRDYSWSSPAKQYLDLYAK